MAIQQLTMDELNKAALEQFVYQPVSQEMVSFLAEAARNVIACDSTMMLSKTHPSPPSHKHRQQPSHLPSTPPQSPNCEAADNTLPSLEQFISQLVMSSNVQVPTLMSSLVYLTRLKSKLQPMARGLRCTTHRIFLASLILSAKYLNDSSPKNKHWANYTHFTTDAYSFGFNRTEVNLMEKQLLFLLDWDLRIHEQDLYRELESFLAPLRSRVVERQARKMRHREEKCRQQDTHARLYTPPASRGTSRSRHNSTEIIRSVSVSVSVSASGGAVTPPGLTYSSSGSSYASSVASSRQQSRATTPLDDAVPCILGASNAPSTLYDSPMETVMAKPPPEKSTSEDCLLPYSMSVEQCHEIQEESCKKRKRGGMWGRLLGGAVAVR
ncbi:hypothetical protein E4U22_005367 [Claviceps purpurea]|nr:hypothetical protein E4U38_003261 [Claviceps purpurea]KAG6144206.1 hypothetical protein E4U28_002130 [Claviceps purpurea]KAG6153182.1 hypothetical protein E4U11_007125 [Claviceps purpurea]KAG6318509.1 hypothetical protein E4U22_005367 [Claviceps purpurea]